MLYLENERIEMKEGDTGPRGGDSQPGQEGGREGGGTRPSGDGK